MPPSPKRPRVFDFRGESYASQRAIVAVLQQARTEGIPTALDRRTFRRQRDELGDIMTPFGTILQEVAVESTHANNAMRLWMAHPFAFLAHALQERAEFARFFKMVLARSNNTLRLVVYTDEVSPTQSLWAGTDTRKQQCVYWSFLDFQFPVLSNEDAWFTITTVRSEEVNRIAGGMSTVLKHALGLFFGDVHDMRRGVVFNIEGVDALVFGNLSVLVQDERGHKACLLFKGSSGHKLCCLCMNVVDFRSRWLATGGAYLVPSSSVAINHFALHTDESVKVTLLRLRALACNPHELERREMEVGFNHSDHNVLLSDHLAIGLASVFMWDWCHCYFQAGVFTKEANALMRRLAAHGHGFPQFKTYVQLWQWPVAYPGFKAAGHNAIGGSASEQLSLCLVLGKFLQDIVRPTGLCDAEVESALAMVDAIELLQHVQTGAVTGPMLERAITKHLQLQLAAYNTEVWLPKTHYVLHLGQQLARHGLLLATWTHERKHRIVKRFELHRQSLTSYDRGVMAEVTNHHFRKLKLRLDGSGLLKPRAASDEERHALEAVGALGDEIKCATAAIINSVCIQSRDVVLYRLGERTAVATVYCHVDVDGVLYSCINPWDHVASTAYATKYRVVEGAPRLVRSHMLLEPLIHTIPVIGDVCAALLPLRYR